MSSSTVASEYGLPTAVLSCARIASFDTVAGPEYCTSMERTVGASGGACCPFAVAGVNNNAPVTKNIATIQPHTDPRNSLITIKTPNPAQRRNWRGTGGT